jgi:two-component system, LuxR family, response regulator FixJ
MTPSIFVVEDDHAVRDSIVTVLRSEGLTVRAFASGEEFFARYPQEETACVVTDLRMPGMDGAELVRRVTELHGSRWSVMVITAHADVPTAIGLMRAGVVDLLEKPFDPMRLVEAVKGCLNYLGSAEAARSARRRSVEMLDRLTSRERQVLDGLVDGLSNKEIARRLEISPRTVEVFRAKLIAKTGAASLSALIQMGLLARTP